MSDENWVLYEDFASEKRGKPVYLKCMTGIGPCTTTSLEDAQKFNSKDEALVHPAMLHMLSFFEPREV
jgi:hypothetical protein